MFSGSNSLRDIQKREERRHLNLNRWSRGMWWTKIHNLLAIVYEFFHENKHETRNLKQNFTKIFFFFCFVHVLFKSLFRFQCQNQKQKNTHKMLMRRHTKFVW